MSCSFYIVDDDRSVRRILRQMLENHFKDAQIQQSDDPWFAVNDILAQQPDIVILDLLMDDMDGIEVSETLRSKKFRGKIVMLSEVTSKEMIEKAYAAGVNDYISKPINVTEVIKVLERTLEHLQLQNYVRLMHHRDNQDAQKGSKLSSSFKEQLLTIFKDLGVLAEPGSEELCCLIEAIVVQKVPLLIKTPTLHQYYQYIKDNEPLCSNEGISAKGIEQRLRRFVQLAMENLALLGVEDFSHYRLEKYATSLFNFKSIKQEMDYLRNKTEERGKVDVRRFIDALVTLAEKSDY